MPASLLPSARIHSLIVLLGGALGCASGGAAAPKPGDQAAAVEKLRTENAAYVRRVEELENQVFILNDELTARRGGEPNAAAPAAVAPPALPEVKLAPGQQVPEPEPTAPPETLVEESAVEYSGAAAERKGKRPVLRLWGDSPAEGQSDSGAVDQAPAAPAPSAPRGRRRPLAPARPTERASNAQGGSPDRAMASYQGAMDLVQSRRHDEAVAALRGFVKDFRAHDLADNAQYWLGECFYDRKDYSSALREFRRVPDSFPDGNKVPDALLKMAFSYLALGSERPARETLLQITRQHPHHPAAALASAKLANLGGATAAVTPALKEPPR